MAVYRNDNAYEVQFQGFRIQPGEIWTPVPNVYIPHIPSGFTKVAESPTPWEVTEITSFPTTVSGLASSSQIFVKNLTNVTIEFTANGWTTEQGIPVVANETFPINQDREVDSITITADGYSSGAAYVIAMRTR